MANPENLRVPTSSEARENGRKGGLASGKARRERKTFRMAFETLMNTDIQDKDTGNVMSGLEAIAAKIFEKALKGDIKAYETIRDIIGEKPIDEIRIEHFEGNKELMELMESLRGETDESRSEV